MNKKLIYDKKEKESNFIRILKTYMSFKRKMKKELKRSIGLETILLHLKGEERKKRRGGVSRRILGRDI